MCCVHLQSRVTTRRCAAVIRTGNEQVWELAGQQWRELIVSVADRHCQLLALSRYKSETADRSSYSILFCLSLLFDDVVDWHVLWCWRHDSKWARSIGGVIPTGWAEVLGDIEELVRLAQHKYQEDVPGIETESLMLLLLITATELSACGSSPYTHSLTHSLNHSLTLSPHGAESFLSS